MWTGSLLPGRISGSILARYAVAFGVVLAALLVSRGLHPVVGDDLPCILLFPAIAFSALYCGIGPSLAAIILALIGLRYWFSPLADAFGISGTRQSTDLIALLLSAGLVVAMGEARRRHSQELRNAQDELEGRIQERTAELGRANHSLRELSARLLRSQDEERRRLARELHDSVGQTLAALAMNLSAARVDIEGLAKTAARLTDSESLVREMSTEVRTMSHLLYPPLLDEAGLPSAVRWYADGFAQRSKIKVDLDIPDDFGRLSQELETAIFRVVQECLTNIHRHSGSSVAKIRLRHHDGEARVEVEDTGKGIPPEKRGEITSAGPIGVGIRGMRERVRQLGGALDIDSKGSGTVVVARLPVGEISSHADIVPTADPSSPTSDPSSTAAA